MTSLLDLPPELFQQVAHELVKVAGPREAWELRKVCRTFAAEIEHDVFTKHPNSMLSGRNHMVLTNSLSRFIMKRMDAPRGANEQILKKISSMVDFLATEIGFTTHQERILYTEELLDGLKKMWIGGPRRLANDVLCTSKTPCACSSYSWRNVADLNIYDKLSASIAVKGYDVIEKLLPMLPPETDDRNIFLECKPLQLAVNEHDRLLLGVILAFLKTLNLRGHRRVFENFIGPSYDFAPLFPMHSVIATTITKEDAETTKILLDFYAENLPKLGQHTFDHLAYIAIIHSNDKVLSHLLEYSPGGTSMVTARRTLSDACEISNVSSIQMVLRHLPSDINEGSILTLPLFIAVRSRQVVAVQTVLDLGAEINILVKSNLPSIPKDLVTPIDVAIHRKELPVIQCLIENGAKVPHISEWPEHKKTYNLLRNVEMNRSGISLPTQLQHKFMTPKELMALEY
ncbi:uncharacterized protein K460DRAFT_356735 [Cucurbitaria berberidis CBS 394.84]|uniref:Uncharacterized protein n=1 Tax=Cucurbitaria berberidis CBS 394.84 TaxID=1168544 RepID=A0A9P4L656_9PLEO|nr:uncharacterized protein K460DRAFT_356735 [Cucurbitaria berberidis CBS 394.84]KAF1842944.1 hypothetical protein K460DRAFT_356735 [Cucurbitaria berberidis CBS 394.84]